MERYRSTVVKAVKNYAFLRNPGVPKRPLEKDIFLHRAEADVTRVLQCESGLFALESCAIKRGQEFSFSMGSVFGRAVAVDAIAQTTAPPLDVRSYIGGWIEETLWQNGYHWVYGEDGKRYFAHFNDILNPFGGWIKEGMEIRFRAMDRGMGWDCIDAYILFSDTQQESLRPIQEAIATVQEFNGVHGWLECSESGDRIFFERALLEEDAELKRGSVVRCTYFHGRRRTRILSGTVTSGSALERLVQIEAVGR